MSKICGIYKITSPSKRVYIGQSVDIYTRWNSHRSMVCNKETPILHNSMKKYGVKRHKFEIITRCAENELNDYEKFFIDLYDATGENGMNVMGGGQDVHCLSEETKEKIRQARIEESKQGKHTSKYLGVYKHSDGKKWVSCITINYKQIRIGVYDTEIEAARAFNEYILKNNLNRKLNVIG